MPDAPHAILMMAHGSPDSLDQMEDYLLDVRGGRPTPPELVNEMRRRYALIGGVSPLLRVTRAQARALESRLNAAPSASCWRAYVGMRHWHPFIRETVAEIAAHGAQKIVALCMAPHYSRLSVGAYFAKLREALDEHGVRADVAYVESWHTHPRFIQAIADKVTVSLDRFPPEARDAVRIVCTAHSLPVSVIEQGDPYDAQLRETARLLARQLGIGPDRWQFCYQSAGARAVPWLGPDLGDVIVELAASGQRNALVVPIGFVADHVEILYDVDIEARRIAERTGVHLERTDSLNISPRFIDALADVVRQAVQSR